MQRLRRMPIASVAEYAFVWADQGHKKLARKVAAYVDNAYYLRVNPDVRDAGIDPALHYVKYGWREGRDPSPSFSTQAYLAEHPELVEDDTNPLLHFVEAGAPSTTEKSASEDEIALVATELDAEFYARTYDLPKEADPAVHYCEQGWRAGWDPSSDFSTSHYLTANLDIRESGVNPFWHYLVAGRAEGRAPKHLGGWRYDILARQQPLPRVREAWLRRDAPPPLCTAEELARRIGDAHAGTAVLISFGHDDYRASPGGVQLCMALEAKAAAAAEVDYLYLCPWQSLPTLSDPDADPVITLLMNNATIGHARMSQVVAATRRVDLRAPKLVIHHLMGHDPSQIGAFARGIGIVELHFWLHDNFSICTNYALQRNDIAFCGAPSPVSNACSICLYGDERRTQLSRLRALFEAFDVHVIAPSKVALDFWKSHTELAARTTSVRPHMRLRRRKTARAVTPGKRCNIAYVGLPAPHKGWPVFQDLHTTLKHDDRYAFWVFGAEETGAGFRRVPIHCTADAPRTTIETLRDNQIDLVLHWATCRETFSFTTFEALAAGAFVVTNAGSGNVAAVVQRQEGGVVLPDQAALMALAKSDGLLSLAAEARARRATETVSVAYSDVTLGCFPREALAV